MFYRQYSTPGVIEKHVARGSLVGPGIVIGLQTKSLWVSHACRSYVVSLEHIRVRLPDDHASMRPVVAEHLDEMRRASASKDCVDLLVEWLI